MGSSLSRIQAIKTGGGGGVRVDVKGCEAFVKIQKNKKNFFFFFFFLGGGGGGGGGGVGFGGRVRVDVNGEVKLL